MNPVRSFLSSLGGALFGGICLIGSFPLLALNENRAVKTELSLKEGQKTVQTAEPAGPKSNMEGKLVHLTGDAKPSGPLVDPATNFSIPALIVERESEMYQWDEESEGSSNSSQRNSSRPKTYTKRWLGHVEDSSSFEQRAGHDNPKHFRVPSGKHSVPSARMGGWTIPSIVLDKLSPSTAWLPTQNDLAKLPSHLQSAARLDTGYLYFGRDPLNPEIGDERIRFSMLPAGPISIVARQDGKQLGEFHTSNGRTILLARAGTASADAMFISALRGNAVMTWVLRGVGALVMFIGMRLIIEPLTSFTDWIPFVGSVVDSGATLGAALLAMIGSAITIAVAWFAVRPVLSGGLVVGAIAIALVLRKRRGRR